MLTGKRTALGDLILISQPTTNALPACLSEKRRSSDFDVCRARTTTYSFNLILLREICQFIFPGQKKIPFGTLDNTRIKGQEKTLFYCYGKMKVLKYFHIVKIFNCGSLWEVRYSYSMQSYANSVCRCCFRNARYLGTSHGTLCLLSNFWKTKVYMCIKMGGFHPFRFTT